MPGRQRASCGVPSSHRGSALRSARRRPGEPETAVDDDGDGPAHPAGVGRRDELGWLRREERNAIAGYDPRRPQAFRDRRDAGGESREGQPRPVAGGNGRRLILLAGDERVPERGSGRRRRCAVDARRGLEQAVDPGICERRRRPLPRRPGALPSGNRCSSACGSRRRRSAAKPRWKTGSRSPQASRTGTSSSPRPAATLASAA